MRWLNDSFGIVNLGSELKHCPMKIVRSRHYGQRFPPAIISYAVWVYHRFCLSFRDVEDLLAERGIIVSYETMRLWCQKFGADYVRKLKPCGRSYAMRLTTRNVTATTTQKARISPPAKGNGKCVDASLLAKPNGFSPSTVSFKIFSE